MCPSAYHPSTHQKDVEMDLTSFEGAGALTPLEVLYADWADWCAQNRKPPGTVEEFAQKLLARGFTEWRDAQTGRVAFAGLRPKRGA
jgi:hypothetical protein